jgi:hypothetical protein
MRLVLGRAIGGRRRTMHGVIGTGDSSNRMWWNLGARAMKDHMLREFTSWAISCPNKETADDLWDFIIKAREVTVDFDTHA